MKPEERLVYPIHIFIVIFGEYLSKTMNDITKQKLLQQNEI